MADQDLDINGVPDELDGDGAKIWSGIAPSLRAAGRIKDTDRQVLARYCDMVGRYWRMSRKVRDEGETLLVPTIAKGPNGEPGKMHRRHPLLNEMKALMPEIRQIEDRMGLSPLARANLVSKLLGRPPRSPGDMFPPDPGDENNPPNQAGTDLQDNDPGSFH